MEGLNTIRYAMERTGRVECLEERLGAQLHITQSDQQ